MDDGYMGSGKIIQQAVEKYGIKNFRKEILEVFDTAEMMYKREREIVTEDFLKSENVYNLRLGGSGGWDYINKNNLNFTEHSLQKKKESLRKWHSLNDTTGENNGFFGKQHSEQTKQQISEKRKAYYDNGGKHPKGMLNKEHSLDTKKHLSEVMKLKSPLIGKKGLEHPSGGTKWYNNGTKHLRSDKPPGEGWTEGRIFKKRKRIL
jgi:group I intron endonuclease